MHILLISDVYFPRVNGVSTSLATFRASLVEHGHRVTLVVPAYPKNGTPPPEDDSDIIRVPSRYLVFDPEDRILRASKLRRCLALRGVPIPDLIHIHTPFVAHYAGLGLAREWGCPTVETYHTFFEDYLHHYLPFLPRVLTRWFARRVSRSQCNAVDHVIAPSHALIDVLRDYGVRAPITRLPTGLQIEKLQGGDGARFRNRQGIAADRPLLLHVSRVAFEKNIDFLLGVHQRVLREVPDTLFVIAGEGPARRGLLRKARQLDIAHAIHWCGYLDRDTTLLDCYAAGDVFVFASRTETQGLVLLEAMATGLPVVSLAHLGARDILTAESGAEVAQDDPDDFARRVVALLRDPEARQRMRDTQRDWAAQWTSECMTDQLEPLYRSVIAESRDTDPRPDGASPTEPDPQR